MQTCLALWWSGGADERDFGSVKKLRRGRKKRGDFDTNLRIKSPCLRVLPYSVPASVFLFVQARGLVISRSMLVSEGRSRLRD